MFSLFHPESPVDSSFFPVLADGHKAAQAPTPPAPAARDYDDKHTPVTWQDDTDDLSLHYLMYDGQFGASFDYASDTPSSSFELPDDDREASLCSVFGDQDLVDAIFHSLEADNAAAQAAQAPTSTPVPAPAAAAATRSPYSSLSLGSADDLSITIPKPSLPCIRKQGTFLNKDGRWIKGKPCRVDNCDKRAQSNGLCKGHGGGARCSKEGCTKSSQGGGFCRAHGGGKRCMHPGCDKGTQRNGFCYLHGGVRACSVPGCDKKDRGNGKCFSHGGGRKCQTPYCGQTIRRGVYCEAHLATALYRNSL